MFFKSKLNFCLLFLLVINLNLFGLSSPFYFEDLYNHRPNMSNYKQNHNSNKAFLVNQPTKATELPITGQNLDQIQQVINKNVDRYTEELTKLEKYISGAKDEIAHEQKNGVNVASCTGELAGLEKRLEIVKERIKYYQDLANSSMSSLVKNKELKDRINIEEKEKEKDRQADIEKFSKGIKTAINESLKKENLSKTSTFLIVTSGGTITTYYGAKLINKYLESIIGVPKIIRETSKLSLMQNMKKKFNQILGRTEEEVNLDDIVLDDETKKILGEFANDTRQTFKYGLNFKNALFWGPPGTGKTAFAKLLTRYCNKSANNFNYKMEYALLSASDLVKLPVDKAIQRLQEIIDWSNKIKGGLILVIDEADAIFSDRKSNELRNQEDDKRVVIVNKILAEFGEPSDKIMSIFITNHPKLDSAILDRVDKFEFKLPDFEQRLEILSKKIQKYIIQDKKTLNINGQKTIRKIHLSPQINEALMKETARKTEGLSGRKIEKIIIDMQIASYTRGNGNLTKEIFNQIVDRKIKEFNQEKSW